MFPKGSVIRRTRPRSSSSRRTGSLAGVPQGDSLFQKRAARREAEDLHRLQGSQPAGYRHRLPIPPDHRLRQPIRNQHAFLRPAAGAVPVRAIRKEKAGWAVPVRQTDDHSVIGGGDFQSKLVAGQGNRFGCAHGDLPSVRCPFLPRRALLVEGVDPTWRATRRQAGRHGRWRRLHNRTAVSTFASAHESSIQRSQAWRGSRGLPVRARPAAASDSEHIVIEGARQNNLQNLSLKLPLRKLIAITGVSGSGKSSLAFDTLYAEGQRRYVETFSSYTRQFLDRMDRPRVDRIDGIPPAIAIDQTNPVRTSRSTVGTMTELSDHLKLLFARAARLYCGNCGREVRRDTAESIADQLPQGRRLILTFPITVPASFSEAEVEELLAKQGYTRILRREQVKSEPGKPAKKEGIRLDVIQDRITSSPANRSRIVEDLEAALKYGQGRLSAHLVDERGRTHRESPVLLGTALPVL